MSAVAAPAPPRRRKKKRFGRLGWNLLALAIFVVMIFPVYWMFSTAFKPTDDINRLTPTWFPTHPTLTTSATRSTGRTSGARS